jgi:hypothetical protein
MQPYRRGYLNAVNAKADWQVKPLRLKRTGYHGDNTGLTRSLLTGIYLGHMQREPSSGTRLKYLASQRLMRQFW